MNQFREMIKIAREAKKNGLIRWSMSGRYVLSETSYRRDMKFLEKSVKGFNQVKVYKYIHA